MVSGGGGREGVGDGGGGVEEPNRLLRAVKGEVKLPKILLEGVDGLSSEAGTGDLIAEGVSTSVVGLARFNGLAASWT